MNIRNYDKTDTINIFGQLEILVILHVMFSLIYGIKPLIYTSERASLLNVQGVEDKLILEKLLTNLLFIKRKSNNIWVQDKAKASTLGTSNLSGDAEQV
jgi:hypothetical protein